MATDWDKAFKDACAETWPPEHRPALTVSATKPKHETARNLWKEDEAAIMAAAARHGFRISFKSPKVAQFTKA